MVDSKGGSYTDSWLKYLIKNPVCYAHSHRANARCAVSCRIWRAVGAIKSSSSFLTDSSISNVPVARCNRRGFFRRKSESTFPHQQKALKSCGFKAFAYPSYPVLYPLRYPQSDCGNRKRRNLTRFALSAKTKQQYMKQQTHMLVVLLVNQIFQSVR